MRLCYTAAVGVSASEGWLSYLTPL